MSVRTSTNAAQLRRRYADRIQRLRTEVQRTALRTNAIYENEIQRRYRAGTGRRRSRTTAAATLARRSTRLASSVRTDIRGTFPRIQPIVFIPRSGPFYAKIMEKGKVIRAKTPKGMVFRTRDGKWVRKHAVVIPRRPVWKQTQKTKLPTVREEWRKMRRRWVKGR